MFRGNAIAVTTAKLIKFPQSANSHNPGCRLTDTKFRRTIPQKKLTTAQGFKTADHPRRPSRAVMSITFLNLCTENIADIV